MNASIDYSVLSSSRQAVQFASVRRLFICKFRSALIETRASFASWAPIMTMHSSTHRAIGGYVVFVASSRLVIRSATASASLDTSHEIVEKHFYLRLNSSHWMPDSNRQQTVRGRPYLISIQSSGQTAVQVHFSICIVVSCNQKASQSFAGDHVSQTVQNINYFVSSDFR